MQMTDNEIVKSYKEAKEKKKQIGILADLNGCNRQEITAILRNNGVDLPGPKPKKTEEPKDKPKIYERITEYPPEEKDILVPICVKEELMSSVEAMTEQINSLLKRRAEIIDFIKRI